MIKKDLFDNELEYKTTRDGYRVGVVEAGRENKNVVVLTADLSKSIKSDLFEKEFPDRFVQVGVAEQNLAGISAGLALSGKVPFMASYAAFSPGRNWEQIRTAICLSKANVKIINSHAGLSASGDGATHQSLEDIALLRVLPGMTVLVPCDSNEAKQAVLEAARFKGPVSIRLSRDETPVMTTPESKFEIGKAEVVKEGEIVTIIACGPILFEVLKAWKELNEKHNIRVEVINSPTIKPLDKETIIKSAKKTKLVITVEEHQAFGGLGSAVAEVLGEELPTKTIRMGVKDTFGESGKYLELLKKHGLDYETIVKKVLNIVSTH